MPETTTTPDSQANADPQQDTQPLLAGKYETPDALERGIREAAARLNYHGIPNEGKLIGEGGVYATTDEAVANYQAMQRILNRQQQAGGNDNTAQNDGGSDGNQPPQETPTNEDGTPKIPDAPSLSEVDDPVKLLEGAGLTNDEVVSQWQDNGTLTDEQYEKLTTTYGVSRQLVDAYMQGQAALASGQSQVQQQTVTSLAEMVGGEEQLNNLLVNARQYVPANRIEPLNALLANPDYADIAVREIQRYQQEKLGSANTRPLASGTAPSGSAEPIRNQAELWEVNEQAMRGDKQAQARLLAFRENGRRFSN